MKKLFLSALVAVLSMATYAAYDYPYLDFKSILTPQFYDDLRFFPNDLASRANNNNSEAGADGVAGDFNDDGIDDFIVWGVNVGGNTTPFMYLYLGQKNADPIKIDLAAKYPDLSIAGCGSMDAYKQADGRWIFAMQGGNKATWANPYKADVFTLNFSGNDVTVNVLASNFTIDKGLAGGTIMVLDANNDGYADILQMGWENNAGNVFAPVTKLWLNNGSFNFTQFTGHGIVDQGSYVRVKKGDFNNDGKIDIAFGDARIAASKGCYVYLNNGNGTFSEKKLITYGGGTEIVPTNTLGNGEDCGVITTILDVDNDGKMDVVFTTNRPVGSWICPMYIFKGDGNGNFTLLPQQNDAGNAGNQPLNGGQRGFSAVADFNNDGKTDFIVTSETCEQGTWSKKAYLYLGNGDGTFLQYDISADYPPIAGKAVHGGCLLTGDFDGSGTTDLMIFGCLYGYGFRAQLNFNSKSTFNADLNSLSVSDGRLLPAFSSYTSNYNLIVPNSVNSITINAAVNDLAKNIAGTGVKTLQEGENVFEVIVTAEDGISKKTYTITASKDLLEDNNTSGLFRKSSYTFNGLSMTDVEPQGVVADFNEDGIDDLFVCGKKGGNKFFAHLYLGQKNADPIEVVLSEDFFGSGNPVMDYYKVEDGKFLLSVQGGSQYPDQGWVGNDVTKAAIYELTHTGSNVFTFTSKATLDKGAGRGALIFLDADGDGHPDLVQYGFNAFGNGNRNNPTITNWSATMSLYMNDGNNNFTREQPASFINGGDPCANGFLRKGDFNNDGKEDFALFTTNNAANTYILGADPYLFVFLNNGDKTFTKVTIPSKLRMDRDRREQISMNIGDFNNDGYLDIFAFSQDPVGWYYYDYPAETWINDGNGNFSLAAGSDKLCNRLSGTNRANIGVGDFNCDGNLDLIYSGWNTQDHGAISGAGGNGNRLFIQMGRGNGLFTEFFMKAGSYDEANNFTININGSYFVGDFNADGVDDVIQLGTGCKLMYSKAENKDATLSELTTSVGTLSPNFSKDVTDYTLNVPSEITSITVGGKANHKFATIESGIGEKSLEVGENPHNVVVKAPNGTTTGTYTINVTRANPTGLTDAALPTLSISADNGVLNASFEGSANIKLYSVTGILLDQTNAVGIYTKALNNGIYILKINERSYKVIVR